MTPRDPADSVAVYVLFLEFFFFFLELLLVLFWISTWSFSLTDWWE
jgi:hypothetical protein